jgi:hypothetical protein
MPAYRRRKAFYGRSNAARRERTWDTLDINTTALANSASANYSLSPTFDAGGGLMRVGMTAVRVHLQVTPGSAPALNDAITFGIIVGRVSDLGDPTAAGQVTVAQQELQWAFLKRFTANPTLESGGSNTIEIDLRSKRRIHGINDVFMISLRNNFVATTNIRVFARTLFLQP